MDKKFFAQVPSIVEHLSLEPYEFRLLLHLLQFDKCYESLETISKITRVGVKRLRQAKHNLHESGLISITYEPGKPSVMVVNKNHIWSLHQQTPPLSGRASPIGEAYPSLKRESTNIDISIIKKIINKLVDWILEQLENGTTPATIKEQLQENNYLIDYITGADRAPEPDPQGESLYEIINIFKNIIGDQKYWIPKSAFAKLEKYYKEHGPLLLLQKLDWLQTVPGTKNVYHWIKAIETGLQAHNNKTTRPDPAPAANMETDDGPGVYL